MTSQTEACSILAVDIGSCRTKAALFDLVERRHRFVARADVPTTLYYPVEDISVGVRKAIEEIERISGRALSGSNGPIVPQRIDGVGVDLFVTTTSLGGSLRLLIITSSASLPLFNQLKSIAELSAVEVEVLSLDEESAAGEVKAEALSKRVSHFDPHAILVVGHEGSSSLMSKLGQDIVEAISLTGNEAVSVRFLGDASAADGFAQGVRDSLDFQSLISSGALTNDDLLILERELLELWEQRVVREIPGYPLVISWQNTPVESSFFALGDALRFLSSYHKTNVLAVDIGSSSVSLFKSSPDGGQAKLSYEYGLGRSAIGLLNGNHGKLDNSSRGGGLSLAHWLPADIPADELGNLVLNKWARPWTLPETDQEALFERAMAVECVQRVRFELTGQRHFFNYQDSLGILIGAGSAIANQSSVGRMALTLLDSLEPGGVFSIAVDRETILTQLGAIGRLSPQAAAEVLLTDALLNVGICIACVPGGRPGSKAATVDVKCGDATQRIEVALGEIHVVPLPFGESADVVVNPSRSLDFGWGKGKSGKLTIKGEALGLIIDARGRPLDTGNGEYSAETSRWLQMVEHQEAK